MKKTRKPKPFVAAPEPSNRSLKRLSIEQWNKLRGILPVQDLRDEALIVLMYEAALRRSEPGQIRLDYLRKLAEGKIYVQRNKKSHSGWVDLQPSTVSLIRSWIFSRYPLPERSREWFLFPGNRYEGQPPQGISGRTVYNVYNRLAKLAALPKDLSHPHVLRRSRSQHLLELATTNKDISADRLHHTLAQLLGHNNARVTIEHYMKATGPEQEFVRKVTKTLVDPDKNKG